MIFKTTAVLSVRRRKEHLFKLVMKNMKRYFIFLILLSLVGLYSTSSNLTVSDQDLSLLTKRNKTFQLIRSSDPESSEAVLVSFNFSNGDSGLLVPLAPVSLLPGHNVTLSVSPLKAGHVDIVAVPGPNTSVSSKEAFVRVDVMKSESVELISTIVGWTYFVAWSVSFYPQIWDNFKRKSVIGLNFDFVGLNIVGFSLYGCYNVALFWIHSVQEQYMERHPRGVIPVQANDVFFPLHAVWACAVTIVQCVIYERGNQSVSRLCLIILAAIAVFVVINLILALTSVILWLDFLFYCSYVKLGITLIKYMPQAYMNFRRKSTLGWSIGNILLDFTGGTLSMLQMFLIAYNNDDWGSLFGDPTKFGLGFFSVAFDIFFMLQHYVFYRGNVPHDPLSGSNEELAISPRPPGTPETTRESSEEI